MSKDEFNRTRVNEITGIPSRRILFYAEQPGLLSGLDRPGRGVRRKYSRVNIAELVLIRELAYLGVTLQKTDGIVFMFRGEKDKWWDKRTNDFKKGDLCLVLHFEPGDKGFMSRWERTDQAVINLNRYDRAIVINIGRILNRLEF